MYVYIIYAELSVGRVDPRVGSGRVQKFLDFRGSGRVQSLCVCIFLSFHDILKTYRISIDNCIIMLDN